MRKIDTTIDIGAGSEEKHAATSAISRDLSGT
jgi:hypothetical protein